MVGDMSRQQREWRQKEERENSERQSLAPSGAVANRVGSSSEKTLYFQDQIPKAQIRRGPQRAATAVSHAQLIALYWVLRNGVPYKEQAHQLEEQRRESLIRHHLHRLSELGYKTA